MCLVANALALCFSLTLLLSPVQPVYAQTTMSERVGEYFRLMKSAPIEEKISSADELISASSDSLVRDALAELLFELYRSSELMGDESVAVHIADKWALGGDAAVFADFNRQSLLGKKAPSLEPIVPLFNTERMTLLYFYDIDCKHCRQQTVELVSLLNGLSGEAPDFIAFYVGSNSEEWKNYIADNFPSDLSVRHYMDAELDSDFQRKYGVDGTPRLFLIGSDSTVLGRRLDAESLAVLLSSIVPDKSSEPEYYGSEESSDFFGRLFSSYGKSLSDKDINYVSDYLASSWSSAASPKEKSNFKQMLGDLLYYLSQESAQAYLESCDYLINKYILVDNGIWTTSNDSLMVLEYAQMLSEFLSRAKPGSKVPAVSLNGTEYRLNKSACPYWKNGRKRQMRSNRLRGERNILLFHTRSCQDCIMQIQSLNAILEAAASEGTKEDIRFFVVDSDKLEEDSKAFKAAADAFDLTRLPYLIEYDASGIVTRRYFRL